MTVFHFRGSGTTAKAVERQVRNWELARAQRLGVPAPQRAEVEDFIAVSRDVGAGGNDVAVLLSQRLSWPVFDKEILDAMAGDDQFRRQVYNAMDERDMGWFEEAVRSLMQPEFTRNDYFHKLTQTVLSLARQGHGIYLGRGVDLILPRHVGFRVRLTAPLEQRIERWAATNVLTEDEARTEIERLEAERDNFIRHRFRCEPGTWTRFDLIINVARFTPEQAVEVILHARDKVSGRSSGH